MVYDVKQQAINIDRQHHQPLHRDKPASTINSRINHQRSSTVEQATSPSLQSRGPEQ